MNTKVNALRETIKIVTGKESNALTVNECLKELISSVSEDEATGDDIAELLGNLNIVLPNMLNSQSNETYLRVLPVFDGYVSIKQKFGGLYTSSNPSATDEELELNEELTSKIKLVTLSYNGDTQIVPLSEVENWSQIEFNTQGFHVTENSVSSLAYDTTTWNEINNAYNQNVKLKILVREDVSGPPSGGVDAIASCSYLQSLFGVVDIGMKGDIIVPSSVYQATFIKVRED